ncbi:MAG: hypothetical protein PHW14_04210 [Candidatus Omnitrophica bacterium]|jgi:hypothetical protein|nr:hypothetical protein [Candidatus Omnitrophota bacterium]
MRRKATLMLALFVTAACLTNDASAGPWTLKKNRLWAETFGRISISRYCFDPDGNRSRWNNGGYSRVFDLEQKFEYGATDNFNLLLGIPYSRSIWKDDYVIHGNSSELTNENFKQPNFGFKYRFLDKPFVAAVQMKAFIFPNADRNKEPTLDEWGNALETRILMGKAFSVHKRPAYVACELGYKIRSKRWVADSDWANTFPVFFETGFSPHDRIMLKTEIDCMISQPGTGRIKDAYTWRIGPIISLLGHGFSSIKKGGESSLNLELQYGIQFAGRGDPNIHRDPTWPNNEDRISAPQEFIAKIQMLF